MNRDHVLSAAMIVAGNMRCGEEEIGGDCHNNPQGPILAVTEMRRSHWPTLRELW